MFDIKEELKNLPEKSGVYIMKDKTDEIIYIGKAKILKNRVRQYFQSGHNDSPKTKTLVSHITHFEYIVTDTELEALILEANLIKKHKPRYNIALKDDKTYPFIKLTVNEMFPRVFMTRNHEKDKAKYFGPYSSGYAIKETIEVIHSIWKLRTCHKKFPRDIGKDRPCLNFFIGKCTAPCSGDISSEDYNKIIDEVYEFLNGKHEVIVKKLELEMQELSDNLEFEKASEIRDKIIAIRRLEEKQKVETDVGDDQDIIAFARAFDEALVQVFFVRNGKMTGREHFMLNGVTDMSREDIMTAFVKQFYCETTFVPKEIILETDILDKEIITQYLTSIREQNVSIQVPLRGEKLRLVQLAGKNAILMLEQFGEQMKREKKKTIGALQEITSALGIDNNLERIEAYDISNIQGVLSVGSMVVFENGKPKRSDYRKFKINNVFGANDYASMEEVLTRRLIRYKKETEGEKEAVGKFSKLPDIIFVDGGKPQISCAKKVLKELEIDIPVCGMVKDDRHRTRGLIYNDVEINLPFISEGFKLITRIQDEVHRFAIEYHRKLREKNQIKSVLDDIEGIGDTRRKALIKHFGSIDAIKRAEISQLEGVESMNSKSAEAVYNFFRINI